MGIEDILSSEKSFRYRLLDRMRTDCEYYLGYGNRAAKHLWGNTEEKQIEYMKALWNSFADDEKPEWLSFEKILEYEKEMVLKPDFNSRAIEQISFEELLPSTVGAALDAHFSEQGWELQLWHVGESSGYQVFFGTGVQVDNLYEYGFPYL